MGDPCTSLIRTSMCAMMDFKHHVKMILICSWYRMLVMRQHWQYFFFPNIDWMQQLEPKNYNCRIDQSMGYIKDSVKVRNISTRCFHRRRKWIGIVPSSIVESHSKLMAEYLDASKKIKRQGKRLGADQSNSSWQELLVVVLSRRFYQYYPSHQHYRMIIESIVVISQNYETY